MLETITASAAVALFTSLATKGADAPAHTLNLLWKVTFGHWDPMLEKIVKENIAKYAKDIDEEISKIPEESINQAPDLSLIGPAFDASKFYVSKETPRKMFARLIAASLDKRKEGSVHHAFVEMIKQMSPLDAKILSTYKEQTFLLNFIYGEIDSSKDETVISDIYLSDEFPEYNESVSLSIGNLSRLGLIDIPTRNRGTIIASSKDTTVIERFRETSLYKDITQNENLIHNEISYQTFLTPLALAFRSICL